MENQIFSFGRFTAYLKKFLSEYRSLRLQFVILTGVFAAIMSISGGAVSFFMLTACLFIFAIVAASSFSAYFSTRVNKIKFLLTPASQFEKLAAMVLHLYIGIPVMFAVSLLIAQYVSILVVSLFTLSAPHFTVPYAGIGWDADFAVPFIISYITSVAMYLMGATIFTRHSFLKTTGLSMLVGFVTSILLAIATMLQFVNLAVVEQIEPYHVAETPFYTVLWVLSVVMTILYLVIAYMRIGEMEANETKK